MPGPFDLTTLATVQAFLSSSGVTPSDTDSVLASLVTTVSAKIMSYLQRSSFVSQTWTDTFDGHGGRSFFLNEWPVTSVTSVTVDQRSVPQSIGQAPGWKLTPWNNYPPGTVQNVTLIGGYCFDRGYQNVVIEYVAGYLVQNEAWVVPGSPFQITPRQALGMWSGDGGVTYANGTPLVAVPSAPAVGQYSVAAGGQYTFNSADAAAAVLISYSYVPSTIGEACMNWVAERYRYRTRIGQRSQNVGSQTSESYDLSAVPAYIKEDLQPFRKVLPV